MIPKEYVQEILGFHFADKHIDPESIQQIKGEAHIIDFPRSLYCDCKRCRSPYLEKVTLGTTITVTTATETYTAYIPNPDKDVLAHKRDTE